MPPASEVVNPVPLTGAELRRIILKDVEDVMSRDCVLSGVSAFGQVSYEVTVKLHFQNLSFPESQIRAVSHEPTEQELAADPLRSHVEGEPPLEDLPTWQCWKSNVRVSMESPLGVEGESPLWCGVTHDGDCEWNKVDAIPTETVAVERFREIMNPTQARVEHGIPVPIVKRNNEGRTEELTAKYPADSVPKGKAKDTDLKEETEREFAEKKRKRKAAKGK